MRGGALHEAAAAFATGEDLDLTITRIATMRRCCDFVQEFVGVSHDSYLRRRPTPQLAPDSEWLARDMALGVVDAYKAEGRSPRCQIRDPPRPITPLGDPRERLTGPRDLPALP